MADTLRTNELVLSSLQAMLETFLVHYGYVALFVGTILEGEVFVLLGAFLAHRGYFTFTTVLIIGALGAFAGDVFYFSLGRNYGRSFILARKHVAAVVPRLEESLRRHDILFLFAVRYVWGIRWAAAASRGRRCCLSRGSQ